MEKWVLRTSGTFKRAVGWNRQDMVGSGQNEWNPRILEFGTSPYARCLMRLVDPEEIIAGRRENYARLVSLLRGRAQIPAPFDTLPGRVCPPFLSLMVDDKTGFHEEMARLGIQTITVWRESHRACPEDLAAEVSKWRDHLVEIPIHQGLHADDIDRVAEATLSVLDRSTPTEEPTS